MNRQTTDRFLSVVIVQYAEQRMKFTRVEYCTLLAIDSFTPLTEKMTSRFGIVISYLILHTTHNEGDPKGSARML